MDWLHAIILIKNSIEIIFYIIIILTIIIIYRFLLSKLSFQHNNFIINYDEVFITYFNINYPNFRINFKKEMQKSCRMLC